MITQLKAATVLNFLTHAANLKRYQQYVSLSKVSLVSAMQREIKLDELKIEVRKAWQALSNEMDVPVEIVKALTGLDV